MKKKDLFIGVATLGVVATPTIAIVACSSDNKLIPEDKDSAVMIVGPGGHTDKGFLQGGYDGVQKAIKANMGLKKYREIKIESFDIPESKQGTKDAILAGGYNIVGVGYQYPSFMNEQEYAGAYPKRQFIGIDGFAKTPVKSNVLAVNFNAEQSSFLAGVASCLFLARNYATYNSDGGLKIGAFGGAAYDSVLDMLSGFIQGIAFYNNNLAKNTDYQVQFIGWGASKDAGFTGGFAAGKASILIVKQLINKKADVIFPVAGGQVASVVDVINELDKKNIKIVGVDSDQSQVFGADGDKFITSSMKDTSLAVFEALKASYGKVAKLEFGKNNNVGLGGGFVKVAEGLIAKDAFKGSAFSSLLKADQTHIDVTSDAKTIYEQLIDQDGAVFKVAKLTKKSSVNWKSKINTIWKRTSDYKVLVADI